MIENSSAMIKQTVELLEEQKLDQASLATQKMYVKRLYEIIFYRLTFIKIKEQMNTKGLYNLIEASRNNNNSLVIDFEHTNIDIEESIHEALVSSISASGWQDLRVTTLELLEEELFKELMLTALNGTNKFGLSEDMRNRMALFLAGKVASTAVNQVFKASLVHFGKELVMNVGRGALLELLTYPLHGYTLPDETRLLDMAEKAPAILLNPEWKLANGKKENSAYVWQTHCLAIIRRPDHVEHIFDKFLESNTKKFNTQMRLIQSANDIKRSPKFVPVEMARSSTYVAPRKIILPLVKKK